MAKKTAGLDRPTGGKSSAKRRYGPAASERVETAMRRRNQGTLLSGKGGRGGRVTSRKQAIAIGLSEAREAGAKVPPKPNEGRARKTAKKSAPAKRAKTSKTSKTTKTARRSSVKKGASARKGAKSATRTRGSSTRRARSRA